MASEAMSRKRSAQSKARRTERGDEHKAMRRAPNKAMRTKQGDEHQAGQ